MKKILYILLALSVFSFVACNKFLDELPDKRAELNTPDKLAQMLVSAYSTELPTLMYEYMSDNVADNGPLYAGYYGVQTQFEAYNYREFTEIGFDVPQTVWQATYRAIASANATLDGIEKLGNPASTRGIKAEALLCRAYGHLILATTFCIAYNPETSTTDLGIPYMEKPETKVAPKYDRGTVAGVYEKINTDIENALPYLSESHITQLKYHFNRKAAYALAARFNLYYGEWDKVVEYATKAIGEDPTDVLRDLSQYKSFTGLDDWLYRYIHVDEPSNLLLLPQRSIYGRITTSSNRYGHNNTKWNQTSRQFFPWNSFAKDFNRAWGSSGGEVVYLPKVKEIFETTNAAAKTGQPHTVITAFTSDETLACRAEAHTMLGDYEAAAKDLNYWYRKNSTDGTTYTVAEIASYYSQSRVRVDPLGNNIVVFFRPIMTSKFNVGAGTQENLLHAILSLRRFEGVFEGTRWPDIKRHGIQVDHNIITDGAPETLTLEPYDKRSAIQLPADVIFAGSTPNPR